MSWISARLPYSAYGKNYLRMIGRRNGLERYFESDYSPYHMRSRLLRPEWMLPAESGFLARTLPHCLLPEEAGTLSQAMYFEATANLTGDMLVKVDRMSMANSLEVRCPLLDHELAELAATIPHDWKIARRPGQANSAGCGGRPAAAGTAEPAEDGVSAYRWRIGFAGRCASFCGTT